MRFPNLLYNFAQLQDIAGGLVLLALREQTLTDTNTSVDATIITVPGDKILVITAAAGFASPGAGQAVTDLQWYVGEDPPPSYEFARGAAGDTRLNFSGEVWAPPGGEVHFAGSFDAGVNANTVQGALHGFLIPRGNIQQG